MALEIFRLIGSVFVDTDAAEKSLSKTDKKAEGVGKTLLNGVKTAAKWGTAIVGGAAAAVTGVTAFAEKTASAADEIDKMSQKIGISRTAYQELDFILSQNGMDVNSLQAGMKTLVNSMQDAQAGSEKAVDKFSALGVSITDSTGALRAQEDVFYDSISALQSMENVTERNALANDLFGRSASELAPLLNSGAGSMEELRQKAHDLGLVLSDDVVNAGVNLTDTMDQLRRSGEAIKNRLGGTVMPLVRDVANYVLDKMPQIERGIQKVSPIIGQLFEGLVPPLFDLAEQLFPTLEQLFSALLPLITPLVSDIVPVAVQLINLLVPPFVQLVSILLPPLLELLQPILDLLGPIINLFTPILNLVVEIATPLSRLISGLLTPLVRLISDKLIVGALKPLGTVFSSVAQILTAVFNLAVDGVMSQVTALKGVFSGFITFIKGVFTGDWRQAWNGVVSIFKSIISGLSSAFKTPINAMISGINTFIRGLNNISIPSWVPGVGGRSFNIRQIPKLASGGVLERGQTGFLEGTGAEAVVPLENNRRWIHAVAQDMQAAGIGNSSKSDAILAAILDALEDIKTLGIYIDKDKLVGALAGDMDKKLGEIAVRKARAY